jgi:hypothetical protein
MDVSVKPHTDHAADWPPNGASCWSVTRNFGRRKFYCRPSCWDRYTDGLTKVRSLVGTNSGRLNLVFEAAHGRLGSSSIPIMTLKDTDETPCGFTAKRHAVDVA